MRLFVVPLATIHVLHLKVSLRKMWLCERFRTHFLGCIQSGTARAALFNATQKRSQRRAKEICNKAVETSRKRSTSAASIPIKAIHSLAPLNDTKMSNAFMLRCFDKFWSPFDCKMFGARKIVNLNIFNKNLSQARDERMQRSYQSAS